MHAQFLDLVTELKIRRAGHMTNHFLIWLASDLAGWPNPKKCMKLASFRHNGIPLLRKFSDSSCPLDWPRRPNTLRNGWPFGNFTRKMAKGQRLFLTL